MVSEIQAIPMMLLTHFGRTLNNSFMLNRFVARLTVLTFSISWSGCESHDPITETAPPVLGSVTAQIVSSYGIEDQTAGIDLPNGLEAYIFDVLGEPIADALVSVYPGGYDPEEMDHQGLGTYRIDVLSGRLDSVEAEYFIEVESEWLTPNRVVLRVPHIGLIQRPNLISPTERSEQTIGEELIVSWESVSNADCYDVATRVHTLENWLIRQECVTETVAIIAAEDVRNFSYLMIRARNQLGDETLTNLPYFSRSKAEAQVRIFLEDPE